jgi:H+-translocating NAD(P) transhydrogenase
VSGGLFFSFVVCFRIPTVVSPSLASFVSTAIGGMLLLASGEQSGSVIPDSPSHWMGAVATILSFINISGGFLVSGKMLDLFRRPEDPKEFFELYGIPAAIVLSGLFAAGFFEVGDLSLMSGTASIAASILCISAIAGENTTLGVHGMVYQIILLTRSSEFPRFSSC